MLSKMLSCLLLTIFLAAGPDETLLIDRIAAVVGEKVITFSDVDKAVRIYPVLRERGETERNFYLRVLKELINQEVVHLEFSRDFILTEDDFELVQTPVLTKAGTMENLAATLREFDMDWNDFRSFIKSKVLYEKVIKEKFQLRLLVSFSEIESFYRLEYLPLQESLGLEPLSLLEMAPLIENHLRSREAEKKLQEWLQELRALYRVENKMEGEE